MSALIDKMRRAREQRVTAGNHTFVIRRPTDLEMLRFQQDRSPEKLMSFVVGWDGVTEGGTNVYVAKPYKLRNSQTVVALDGVNISYVYDGGTLMRAATHPNFQSDVQKIIPRYLVNDIILCRKYSRL